MTPYQLNKTVGLGLPLLVIFGLLFLFDINDPVLWWVLVIIAHTFGYMHFLLGYHYQHKSLRRKNNKKLQIIFYSLTLIALVFSVILISVGLTPLLAMIAIGYFIVHGTMNEHTIMTEQVGFAPPMSLFIPFSLYVTSFFILSLAHPSFFFTPKLEFLNPPPEMAVYLLNQIVSVDLLTFLAYLFLVLFIVLVPVRLLVTGSFKPGLAILLIIFVTFYIFKEEQPLNYTILYSIALLYHFISWSLYFYQKLKLNAPERIPVYICDHVLVLIPFVLVSVALLLPISNIELVHRFVFDGTAFITLAMIHNTTSLLNETWFLKILKV